MFHLISIRHCIFAPSVQILACYTANMELTITTIHRNHDLSAAISTN